MVRETLGSGAGGYLIGGGLLIGGGFPNSLLPEISVGQGVI